MQTHYIFTSARLGFRTWKDTDISSLFEINQDPAVMKFFPELATLEETKSFVTRMQEQFKEKGFCYFAVDRLQTSEFIGFIGLSEKTFNAEFTPCIDIGWRLAKEHWGQGYATEGAEACLNCAFNVLGLEVVFSFCPEINLPSKKVMKKIGMQKAGSFDHPQLVDCPRLLRCDLFKIEKPV